MFQICRRVFGMIGCVSEVCGRVKIFDCIAAGLHHILFDTNMFASQNLRVRVQMFGHTLETCGFISKSQNFFKFISSLFKIDIKFLTSRMHTTTI